MVFLGGTISWAFYREWEWPQTVFIVLHCLVLLMKQHSYAFYTGWLSIEFLRRKRLQKELAKIDGEILKVKSKLENPAFCQKVPPAVLDDHRQRLADWQGKREKVLAALANLEG